MKKNKYKYANEMLQKIKSFKEVNEKNIDDIKTYMVGLLLYFEAENKIKKWNIAKTVYTHL